MRMDRGDSDSNEKKPAAAGAAASRMPQPCNRRGGERAA